MLDKLGRSQSISPPTKSFSFSFFKPTPDRDEVAWQNLHTHEQRLLAISQFISPSSPEKKTSSLKVTGCDIKSLWSKGKIAELQEKYFVPLEKAQGMLKD